MDMTQYAGSESKYLKASDLGGGRPRVKIEAVNLVEFDDEEKGKHRKPTVKFEGKEKELVLNATNTEEIIRAFGADSDGWIGKELGLSTKYYKAFDREGIVVSPVVPNDELDDDIPFAFILPTAYGAMYAAQELLQMSPTIAA
jgi:hypothetical protein